MSFQRLFTGKQATSFADSVSQLSFSTNTKFVRMQQVHGNSIRKVPKLDHFDPEYLNHQPKEIVLPLVDACFTTQKNLFLSVKTADCLPILISGVGYLQHTHTHAAQTETHDQDQNSSRVPVQFVAAAHAGRKGTQLGILSLLLERLNHTYNIAQMLKSDTKVTVPQESKLDVWFGPAVCESCYQIDRATDTHFNLIAGNKKQLQGFYSKHGLNLHTALNLVVEPHCTLHEPEKYHSYRATGPGVKMNYSYIGII